MPITEPGWFFLSKWKGRSFSFSFLRILPISIFWMGWSLKAQEGGDSFRLSAQKRSDEDIATYFDKKKQAVEANSEVFLVKSQKTEDGAFEMLYRSQDRWVWERVIATPEFFYSFHTESDQMIGNAHRKFVSSFTVSPM